MRNFFWRRMVAALALVVLLTSSIASPIAVNIAPRSAAQAGIRALTADMGQWVQSWDSEKTGPYDLILGKDTASVILTPDAVDQTGNPPTMTLYGTDPGKDPQAQPLMTLNNKKPSAAIVVQPGVIQEYWLKSVCHNAASGASGETIVYALRIYRTPIQMEFRAVSVEPVGDGRQLTVELWMNASQSAGLRGFAFTLNFDPERLWMTDDGNQKSEVLKSVAQWHDLGMLNSLKLDNGTTAISNGVGRFSCGWQSQNELDPEDGSIIGPKTYTVNTGLTLVGTFTFGLAEGAVLDDSALRVEGVSASEYVAGSNGVITTKGDETTGYLTQPRLRRTLTLPQVQPGGELLVNGNPATGAVELPYGTKAVVTAQAQPGYSFRGWAGAENGDTLVVDMVDNVDLSGHTAEFSKNLAPDLPEPEPVGCTVAITDVDGVPLIGVIPEGTPVLMTATPNPGREFSRWEQVERPGAVRAVVVEPDLSSPRLVVPYQETVTYRPLTVQATHISELEYDILPVLDNLILGGIQGRELVRRALSAGDIGFTGLCLQYDLYLTEQEDSITLKPLFRQRKWTVTAGVDAAEPQSVSSGEEAIFSGLNDGSVIHLYVDGEGRDKLPIEYTVTIHKTQPKLSLQVEQGGAAGTALSLTASGGSFYAIELSLNVPEGAERVVPEPLEGFEYKTTVRDGRMTVVVNKPPKAELFSGQILTLRFPQGINLAQLNLGGKVTTDTHVDVPVEPQIQGMIRVSGAVWSYNTSNAITIAVERLAGSTYVPYSVVDLPKRTDGTIRAFAQDFSLILDEGATYRLAITKPGHAGVTLSELVVAAEDISLIDTYGDQIGKDGIHLPCGDGNGDGSINVFDKAELTDLTRYGKTADSGWDLDGDGRVNVFDLNILTDLANYGKGSTTISLKEGGA